MITNHHLSTGESVAMVPSEIKFGSYNNNNKTNEQHDAWHQSWYDFSEGNLAAGIEKIFYYLQDQKENNLEYECQEHVITFRMCQGSAMLDGSFDGNIFLAKSIITKLEKTSPVIMRRLLDRNQGLLFCRIALDEANHIVAMMNFSSELLTPNIIYSGFRELLLLTDELDDSLAQQFGQAVSFIGNELKQAVSDKEAATKYQYFKKWIADAQNHIKTANRSDLHTIGVYIPLTLVHRIQYLCSPKGLVEEKLRAINNTYWENAQTQKLNIAGIYQKLAQMIGELDTISEQDFKECLYRTRDSFSSRGALQQKEAAEIINHTISETRDTYNRSFPGHALYPLEFALGNLIYDFNLPYIFVALYHLQMQILHPEFFDDLGISQPVFEEDRETLNTDFIKTSLNTLIDKDRNLFPNISFDLDSIEFKDAYSFCLSIAIAAEKMVPTLS